MLYVKVMTHVYIASGKANSLNFLYTLIEKFDMITQERAHENAD